LTDRESLTVKEADNVREIHIIVNNDLAIILDQRERYEEDQVRRAHVMSSPDRLPHRKYVVVHEFCRTIHISERLRVVFN